MATPPGARSTTAPTAPRPGAPTSRVKKTGQATSAVSPPPTTPNAAPKSWHPSAVMGLQERAANSGPPSRPTPQTTSTAAGMPKCRAPMPPPITAMPPTPTAGWSRSIRSAPPPRPRSVRHWAASATKAPAWARWWWANHWSGTWVTTHRTSTSTSLCPPRSGMLLMPPVAWPLATNTWTTASCMWPSSRPTARVCGWNSSSA